MEIEEKYFMELQPRDLKNASPGAKITPERWMAGVRRTLRKVEATKVGGLLLRSIAFKQRWTWIQPYWWANFNKRKQDNADVQDSDFFAASKNRRIWCILRISPENFGRASACAAQCKGHGAVGEAHEAMFHELVHVFRVISRPSIDQGTSTLALRGGLRDHTTIEEFFAVLLTNIYASANGKRHLRANHRTHDVLPDDLDGSFSFFSLGEPVFRLVQHFCWAHKGFTGALAKIDAPFNPIRAYHADPARARSLSEGALARTRDAQGATLSALEKIVPGFHFQSYDALMRP